MGLDMYLSAKKYLWKIDESDAQVSKEIQERINVRRRVKEVVIEAAYWRKANQIHGWFVRNVQDGEDDCNPYDVARSDLVALLDACRKVLENRKLAAKLLPPAEGFFFGRYEYDDSYFEDVQRTADGLAALLEAVPEGSGWWFEYQSSW